MRYESITYISLFYLNVEIILNFSYGFGSFNISVDPILLVTI
jgi:hypothetical protein